MADTGAPWNLPYPLPTDLVRDGADAIKDLAEAAAAGLDLAGNPGIGSNVVQGVRTTAFTSNSVSYVNITDLVVNITPSSSDSRMLLIAHVDSSNNGDSDNGRFAFHRNSTAIGLTAENSTASAIAPRVAGLGNQAFVFLDSPNTTDEITYSVRARTTSTGRTVTINPLRDTSRSISTLTVIEVAA